MEENKNNNEINNANLDYSFDFASQVNKPEDLDGEPKENINNENSNANMTVEPLPTFDVPTTEAPAIEQTPTIEQPVEPLIDNNVVATEVPVIEQSVEPLIDNSMAATEVPVTEQTPAVEQPAEPLTDNNAPAIETPAVEQNTTSEVTDTTVNQANVDIAEAQKQEVAANTQSQDVQKSNKSTFAFIVVFVVIIIAFIVALPIIKNFIG